MPPLKTFSALADMLHPKLPPMAVRGKPSLPALVDFVGNHEIQLTPEQSAAYVRLLNSNPPEFLNELIAHPRTTELPYHFSDNPVVRNAAAFFNEVSPTEYNPFALNYTRANYSKLRPDEYFDLYHGVPDGGKPTYQFLDPERNAFGDTVFLNSATNGGAAAAERWAEPYGKVYNAISQIERPLIFEPAPETWGYAWNDFFNARLSPTSHPEAAREFIQKTGYNPYSDDPWDIARRRIVDAIPNAGYLSSDTISGSPLLNVRDATVYRGMRDISTDAQTIVTPTMPQQMKLKNIKNIYPDYFGTNFDPLAAEYTPLSPYGAALKNEWSIANAQYEKAMNEIPGAAVKKEYDYAKAQVKNYPKMGPNGEIPEGYWSKFLQIKDKEAKAKEKWEHILFSDKTEKFLKPYQDAVNTAFENYVDVEREALRKLRNSSKYTPKGLHTYDASYPKDMWRAVLAAPAAGVAAKAMSPAEAQAAIQKDYQDSLQGMSPSWYLDPIELGATFLAGAPLRTIDLAGRALNTAGTFLFDTILGAIPKADIQAAPEEYYTAAQ